MKSVKILVTGVYGFIGSYFVRWLLNQKIEGLEIRGLARNSDQRKVSRCKAFIDNENFNLYYGDLTDINCISGLAEGVDYIINFAAKTFVDHSIKDPLPFIQSNIVGTYNLLEEARKNKVKKYVQVSTDEVYGSILKGAYKEDSRLNPTNPYSASKAAADMLVQSYNNTYGLDYIITRTENNHGPYQHPQKVIPTFVNCLIKEKPLPVYGDGKHRRMWLYVEDHCSAIWHLIEKDLTGIFHIAGEQELENIELAKKIIEIGYSSSSIDILDIDIKKWEELIEFIPDYNIRPGHDRRYALDVSKLKATGWKPKYSLDRGLELTVKWYINNQWWLNG